MVVMIKRWKSNVAKIVVGLSVGSSITLGSFGWNVTDVISGIECVKADTKSGTLENGLKYEIIDNEDGSEPYVIIKDYCGYEVEQVEIPEEINGYKVTCIGDFAFCDDDFF